MADFPQGIFSFTGIPQTVGGDMTYSRGITPGVCILRTVAQPQLISLVGDLLITYGGETIKFPECAVNTHSLRKERDRHKGWFWSIQVRDRRWKWEYQKISGIYNQRMPDDSVRSSPTHPEIKKNLQELAVLCLTAMGEVNPDVGVLPTNSWPPSHWEDANPAQELAALCDLVSCVVVYDWKTDSVQIRSLGVGATLPLPTRKNPVMPVTISKRPDFLSVECWPTKFQLKFELEAVAYDPDYGKIVAMDGASYAPATDKWKYNWWCAFPNVAATSRHWAFESAFRWYRIKGLAQGGLAVPQLSETIKSVDQFYLEDGLVQLVTDIGNMPQTRPTIVEGEFWPQCHWQATTNKSAVYDAEYRIHPDHRNVIEFAYPVFKVTTSGSDTFYEGAKLYLTARCQIRKENGDWFVAESLTKNLPWRATGAGPRILKHPELWKSVIYNYSDTTSGSTISDNVQALTEEANVYLSAVALGYNSGPQEDVEYASVLPLTLDGAIAQIRWRAGIFMLARTRASRNHEFDLFTPSADFRRRTEKIDTLANREVL